MDMKVLKAFVYDLVTSLVTLGAVYMTVPENVASMGFSEAIVPIVVGVAGALVIALRRYVLEGKR